MLVRDAVLETLTVERADDDGCAEANLGVSGALFVRLEARVGLRVLPLLLAELILSDAGILGRAAVDSQSIGSREQLCAHCTL